MTIYLDNAYKCHIRSRDGYRQVESMHFDGKCDTYIEGYRFVPEGERWVREDGVVFSGEMVSPWKPWQELDEAQREYERQLVAEYEAALREIEEALGVTE